MKLKLNKKTNKTKSILISIPFIMMPILFIVMVTGNILGYFSEEVTYNSASAFIGLGWIGFAIGLIATGEISYGKNKITNFSHPIIFKFIILLFLTIGLWLIFKSYQSIFN